MRIFLTALVAASALSTLGMATGAFAAEGAVLKLKAPAKAPTLIQDGAMWRCNGDVCAAPQVKSLPIGRACRKVAAELGAVDSFNYRGQDLDAAGIADCNTAAKS
ncbi:CC_3452 family protein [Caulobacter sp. LjRoot300]|uniref:CC_3452 family protein n=1 Tax=Caulobacter sp. LjRoot300 TaxID=3342321 RepID=UPI003ECC27C1